MKTIMINQLNGTDGYQGSDLASAGRRDVNNTRDVSLRDVPHPPLRKVERHAGRILVAMWAALLAVILMTGCASFQTAVNTKDVTKITVTTTGLRVGMGTYPQTPELTIARHQVEYYKVPTGLNSTNSQSAGDVTKVPSVAGSYEAGAKSALFGDATVTTTVGVGDPGVQTIIGGQHVPINAGSGTADASNSKLYSNPLTFGPASVPAPAAGTNGVPVPKN